MKPGDFLLGVFDFFAVLMPGSLATWLVAQYIPAPALREALAFGLDGRQAGLDDFALGFAFLLSSYTLGHVVFMAGAKLDSTYDRWRARKRRLDKDHAYKAAAQLQKQLNPELVGGTFTTLKWARTYVNLEASGARTEIDRLEADQKFFRSLVVVSIALAAHFMLGRQAPVPTLAAIALTVVAYQRYKEQRWKMCELIFATAVIANRLSAATSSPGRTCR